MDVPHDSIDRSLAIPHVIPPSHADWRDLKRNTDLVLDRLRIVELLGTRSVVDVLQPRWLDRIDEQSTAWLHKQSAVIGEA
jgi:hypothetical protein